MLTYLEKVVILKSIWHRGRSALSGLRLYSVSSSAPGFEIVKNTGLVEIGEVAHILASLKLGRVHLAEKLDQI